MKKYKKIIVKEIVLNGLIVDSSEEEFIHKNAFFEYKLIKSGDEILLKANKNKDGYDQFSLLFDNEYQTKNFKKNQIYNGKIIKKINNFYILNIENNFSRIYQEEINCAAKIDDYINVALNYRDQFSMYEAMALLFKNEVKESGLYSFKIKDVVEITSHRTKEIIGYNYITDNGLKIFSFANKSFLDKLNYSFIKNKLLLEEELIYSFYYDKSIDRFNNFRIEDSLKEEHGIGILKYSQEDKEYYIETDIGFCNLNIVHMSYLERQLLKNYLGLPIEYELYYKRGKIDSKVIQLKQYDAETFLNLLDKEVQDIEVVNVIDTALDKRIYTVSLGSKGFYGFIEKDDYTYGNEVLQIGERIERLKVKDIINRTFIFLTRKPYITNPKDDFFKDRITGDKILGKVVAIYDEFISVLINSSFIMSIFKDDLKPYKFFKTNEFYEVNGIYSFYIYQIEPDIKLKGFDFNSTITSVNNLKELIGTKLLGTVYKQLMTKYIIRLDGDLEAELPIDEVNYEEEPITFEEDIRYEFKIIDVETFNNQEYKIILSRKRLSSSLYEYKLKNPVGSIVKGTYFFSDDYGYYFNMKYKDSEFNDVIGYLPIKEAALYPKPSIIEKNLINNEDVCFSIVSYPNDVLHSQEDLKSKTINLSILKKDGIDLNRIYSDMNEKDIVLSRKNIIDNKDLYGAEDNKIYFKIEVRDRDIIFSLDYANILPGIKLTNSINKFVSFMDELQDSYKKLNSLERDVLDSVTNMGESNTNLHSDWVLRSFDKEYINKYNHTIEVSLDKNIIDMLINRKEKISITYSKDPIYLGDSKYIPLPVKVLDEGLVTGTKYDVSIVDYSNKIFIANVKGIEEEHLGQKIPVKIIEKLDEEEYLVSYLQKGIGTLKSKSKNDIDINEVIYATIDTIEKNNVTFIYDGIVNFNILEQSSMKDIQDYLVSNVDKLNNREDLIKIYTIMKEKCNNKEINKYEEILQLIKNGFIRKHYVFDKNEFAAGNFGRIYEGRNLRNGDKVVCKRYTSNNPNAYEHKKFETEAKTLIRLTEEAFEGVVETYDFFEESREYVSKYIEAGTLDNFMDKHKDSSIKTKLKVFMGPLIRTCEIMDELDLEEINHCDIKPQNIGYDSENDEVYILDFGCIQTPEERGGFGTIFYASPHQCYIYSNQHLHFTDSHNFDVKDDIYSFGVMMYEVFAGRLPYEKELPRETLIRAHQYGQIDRDSEYTFYPPTKYIKDIPRELEDIILKCMAINKAERYEDFSELRDDLEEIKCLVSY